MTESYVAIPVELICVACSPPLFGKADLIDMEPSSCILRLAEPETPLQKGFHVIIDCWGNDRMRILGQVTEIEQDRVFVAIRKSMAPDKRIFPRLYGGIEIRYRHVDKERWEEASRSWMAGEPDTAPEEWLAPDPFMDFSVSGLKFEGPGDFASDECLLVELKVPLDEELRRATARVVRVDLASPQADPATRRAGPNQIAIHFLELPLKTAESLVRFTLHLQEALL